MFGLGVAEIVILLIIGLVLVAGSIVAVVIALSLARKSGRAAVSDAADLRADVARLRDDVERLKKGSA